MLPLNEIILGDAIETMRGLPDGCIDAIITDPPYGTTSLKWDKRVDWLAWWKEAHRITKPSSVICLFSQQPFTTDLISSNRKEFRYEIIYEKSIAMGFLDANIRPMRCHENILIFCRKYRKSSTYNPQFTSSIPYKKNARVGCDFKHYNRIMPQQTSINNTGTRFPRSVIKFSNSNYKSKHPTQKPIQLMQYLVTTYSNPDEVILDPFIGSGSTAEACLALKRNFIGIEKDEKYYEIANSRIENYSRSEIPKLFDSSSSEGIPEVA